jgi:mannose/fructose/N-acetylgalactosamine-specific phosphotransferase system component IIC
LIPVAAVILSGVDQSAAIALAIPVGTLINYANTLISPIQLGFLGLYDKYAANNDQKKYVLLHYLYLFVITPLPRALIIFVTVWLGVGNIGGISSAMPIWLIDGLNVSMIWSKKLGIFFFVGFVLAELVKLSTMGVAIIALAIAIAIYLVESGIKKSQQNTVAIASSSGDEEDLF